ESAGVSALQVYTPAYKQPERSIAVDMRRVHFTQFQVLCGCAVAFCCVLLAACGGTTGASEGISTTALSTSTASAASTASAQAGNGPTPTTSDSGSGSKPLSQMVVYAGSATGDFFAVNAGTGKQIWKTAINGSANKPTVSNGVVFVTTDSGY